MWQWGASSEIEETFRGLIEKYLGDGLRVGEVGGNGTEGLKVYAEGGMAGITVSAASADVLWPRWRVFST